MRPLAWLVGLILLLPASVHAAAGAGDALRRFVERVETLSARFEQVQSDEDGKELQRFSGQMWLARPGKFRWSYERPYAQLMVCDGKTLWLYDPDLAQVTVRPAGATLQGTPAQLLTDRAGLERHFRIEDGGSDGSAQRVRLLPRASDSDFKSVELWLKDGVPQRMRFRDHLGGTSDVTFQDVRTNAPVDASQFRFEVPKGVEVISAE